MPISLDDDWDNVTKNSAGATNAQLSALEEGLNLQPMPDEVKANKELLGIYLNGLRKEKSMLTELVTKYRLNFSQGEESEFYAITGELMTTDDFEFEVAHMNKRIIVSDHLIETAVKAQSALSLAAFNASARANISQLQSAVAASERLNRIKEFVDGVDQRSALESYKLLKAQFPDESMETFSDMIKMLDDCHLLMDAEEAQAANSKNSNSEKLSAFESSDGYKSAAGADVQVAPALKVHQGLGR